MEYRLNIERYIELLKKESSLSYLKIKRNFWNYFLTAHVWKVKFPMIEKMYTIR